MSPYRLNARVSYARRLDMLGLVVPILMGILGSTMVIVGIACSGAPTPVQQTEESAWGAADLLCTQRASSRAQDDACRDGLRLLFCADGGVMAGSCGHVRLSDGGRP